MAFYTAEWVRKLVKEDHIALQQHISKKGNDFRSYIDSTLPFSLYLDIGNIRTNVLKPNSKFITELAKLLNIRSSDMLIQELDLAYQRTINYYIDTYTNISSEELSAKLNDLRSSIESGNIKSSLQGIFKNTVCISNISKRNRSVLILSPKFTTIQSKFGSVVKENFDLSKFSDMVDDSLGNSPRKIVKAFLDKNFAVLNNLGHVEVDVISSVSGSTEVKRGLVSPRLLQALIDWPKDSRADLLTRKFSKETGQAETRIKVRKKFTGTKLVLEMLIEAGIMIGSVESQEENLKKAPRERAFLIGQNLTTRIKANPTIITELETSKSIKGYVLDTLASAFRGTTIKEYSSITDIVIKSLITKDIVRVVPKAKSNNSSVPKGEAVPLRKPSDAVSLVSLQALLNEYLPQQLKRNMGDGSATNVLNYRTGRFAESAKVERLSVSRQGMITAFYTYMKNPYATFSAEGAQGFPPSRDPKLLISKSIREIAANRVANRMRAVLV